MKRKGISVFFPAYNDGGTIGSLVLMALRTLRQVSNDFEVVIVNDGSTDYTAQVLEELTRQYAQVRVIDHQGNRGYGAALITGFNNCSKELIFYTDGDGQYDVSEMPLLLSEMDESIDWVNGYKILRSDPLHRKIIGRIYHWIARIAFGLKLRDVDCDFRLMRRAIFDKVHLVSQSGVICVEMMKKFQDAGFRLKEVPVHHYFRAYGKSQFFNFPRIFRVGINLVQLWWSLVIRRRHLQ